MTDKDNFEVYLKLGWIVEDASKTHIVFIPENEYGIKEGYYTKKGLVALLRLYSKSANKIIFIADMLE